jgi:restriction endonuclease Mrr
MPIPDYQSIMLPLLKEVADEKEHKFRDLIEILASTLSIKFSNIFDYQDELSDNDDLA